ncbi:MAG: hypothetical protein DYG89_13010 [Caldilinea sp. CFX5]|nr:hypothetical protein [Caldilinea sp. CFX5]
MTKAPAVAMEGVRRKELRSQSNQPTRTSGCVRATEWGAGRCGARSCIGDGAGLVSWVVTLATGLTVNVAATSAKTCFLSWSAKSTGICFMGKCLRKSACSSCSFRLSAIRN